jgi:hypothetical protein
MKSRTHRLGLRIDETTKVAIDEICRALSIKQSELIESLIRNYKRNKFHKDKHLYRVRLARALEMISER